MVRDFLPQRSASTLLICLIGNPIISAFLIARFRLVFVRAWQKLHRKHPLKNLNEAAFKGFSLRELQQMGNGIALRHFAAVVDSQAAAASLACGDFVLILSSLQIDGTIFLLGMTEAPGTVFHVFPHAIIRTPIFARRVTFFSKTTQ